MPNPSTNHEIKEDTGASPKALRGRPFRTILRFNSLYARQYLIGAGLAVVFTLISLLMPLIIRSIVEGLNGHSLGAGQLWFFFWILLLTSASAGVARYFQRILMIGASRRFEYDLRNTYFRHLQRLSASFFQRTPTGDLMARATSDINQVRDFVGPGVMGSVDMIRLPFTLAMMVYFSPTLTLYALLPLPLLTLLVYLFMKFINSQSKIVQDIYSEVSTGVQENLAGARVVRAFGIEDAEIKRFRETCVKYMDANVKLAIVTSLAWPLIDLLVGIAVLLVIWQGGDMVIKGVLSLGNLTAFLITMVMLAWPLIQFGWVLTLYQRGAVSMNRLSDILCETPEISDNARTNFESVITQGEISFENVSFRYPSPQPVEKGEDIDLSARRALALENISFLVPAGTTLAVVGPTGSGKSTILSLLLREFDPESGQISIDGHAVSTVPLGQLRRALGCVPQDTFIFSDNIRENIRLGAPDADDAEILQMLKTAGLQDDVLEMPNKLDTLLGERGVNLSGGQKQRLALARALLKEPKVLLLDDTLSSVDTRTEEIILRELREYASHRTCIVISHRLSAIRDAQHIVVLEDGRIVEKGNHEQLLHVNGLYARMYRRQLLESRLEEVP